MKTLPLTLIISAVLMISSCKKNSDNPPPNPPNDISPVITAIDPFEGAYKTNVTISGKNFSDTIANNIVKFNGVVANVIYATKHSLIAEVPLDAGTGAVTVTVEDKTGIGPAFTYIKVAVTTLAGDGTQGYKDGNSTEAEFNYPNALTVDKNGNIYVADANNVIRKISTTGVVSTLAGSGRQGYKDTIGSEAEFTHPSGVAVDAQGYVYVTDRDNGCIRKITPNGEVTTFAGKGLNYGHTDGLGSNARFGELRGITIDEEGNLYVVDGGYRIRKITPAGMVSTLAGTGEPGYVDGAGNIAQFNEAGDLEADINGNIYVADKLNDAVRKITPDGTVSTIIKTIGVQYPFGITANRQGTVYITQENIDVIQAITSDGHRSVLAGNRNGYKDGESVDAQFYYAKGLAVDIQGNIYVADQANQRIRKISIEKQ